MGNIFTLESLREELDREFAPFQMDMGDGRVLTMRNLMRLPEKNQDKVFALLDEMGAQKSDDESSLSVSKRNSALALDVFLLVADDEKLAKVLVDNLRDDMALTMKVFSAWMDGAQAGEAEASDS